MGESIEADLVQSGMKTVRLRFDVPDPRSKKQPVNVPEVVTVARVANGLGLNKISMFPGMVGIDVANSISAATRELAPDRLIVDLSGNTGGGMGCLLDMSYLCPDRRGGRQRV